VPRDLIRGAIEAVHQRRAGGARVVPAKPEHEVVEEQGVLVPEQLGELDELSQLVFGGPREGIVLF
jgi:hypothetical protein